MNKYTKWIVGAMCAMAIASSTFAADVVKASSTATVKSDQASLFNSGELGVTLGTSYTVDRAALLKQPYTLNANVGAFWFPFRNLGLEANVPFYQSKGVSVSEVQSGLVLRVPLSKTVPVFRNLSPYLGAGAVYNWNTDQKWAYVAKAGLDVRLNKKWGVFSEAQYRNYNSTWADGQTSVVGGLKLVF